MNHERIGTTNQPIVITHNFQLTIWPSIAFILFFELFFSLSTQANYLSTILDVVRRRTIYIKWISDYKLLLFRITNQAKILRLRFIRFPQWLHVKISALQRSFNENFKWQRFDLRIK